MSSQSNAKNNTTSTENKKKRPAGIYFLIYLLIFLAWYYLEIGNSASAYLLAHPGQRHNISQFGAHLFTLEAALSIVIALGLYLMRKFAYICSILLCVVTVFGMLFAGYKELGFGLLIPQLLLVAILYLFRGRLSQKKAKK